MGVQSTGWYFHFLERKRGHIQIWKEKNIYKYQQDLKRRRQLYLSVGADGSRVYQQMALPVESQTVIIAINEILFKPRTEGIKFSILCVDSVEIVDYKKVIGKNSLQSVLIMKNQ